MSSAGEAERPNHHGNASNHHGNARGKENPMKTANIFSKLFFCWTFPLFNYGYKNTLHITDLYRTMEGDSSRHLADRLMKEWDKELEEETRTGQEPSLLRAIIRAFRGIVLLNAIMSFFAECIFKMGQPIMLGLLVQYFAVSTEITTRQAYIYAAVFSICVAGVTLLHHPVFFTNGRIGMRLRVAISALVYRKALRLSNAALGKTTVGQLVNILSNDVNRFDQVFMYLNYSWVVPIQATTMVVVLWSYMGPSCLIALFTFILVAPIQGVMGKLFSKLRAKTATLTDERVRIMNEIITGMKVIKVHAWEWLFTSLVEDARREEIERIQGSSFLRSFNLSFFFVSSKLVLFTTFVFYAATGNLLQSSVVFVAIPMFEILRLTATLALPYCIQFFLEAMVSVKRTKNFLRMDEIAVGESLLDEPASHHNFGFTPDDDDKLSKGTQVNFDEDGAETTSNGSNGEEHSGNSSHDIGKPRYMPAMKRTREKAMAEDYTLQIRNLRGSWDYTASHNRCLSKVSFTVGPKELVAVIGPVGSGKSSLFMALMGELPDMAGEISFNGSLAYTPQQPWVFSGTLRENVLFGRPYNRDRYETALSVCALKKDISILPEGDLTMIGERGVTLSGGQRARVSLARAVYEDAGLYLLDDPLSAVDTAVGRHLFERCIKTHLRNKPVILVTHQLQYLSAVDKIVVLKDGKMVDCGTYEELQSKGVDFASLLKYVRSEDKKFHRRRSSARQESVISLNSLTETIEDLTFTEDYSEADNREGKEEGSVKGSVYTQYLLAGTGILMFIVFMVFNMTAQVFFVLSDWWLSEWAFTEETCALNHAREACLNDQLVTDDAWGSLFHSKGVLGKWEPLTASTQTMFLEDCVFDLLGNFTNLRVDIVGRRYYFYIYATFLVTLLFFTFIRTTWLFYICVNASKNLHNRMLAALIRTSMQFFETNPVGRILNRFSKDIGFMDETLPLAICDFNQISFQSLAFMLTIFIFNPIVIVITAPLVILFLFVRAYYLATSRDIKRIEGICRSPIFSHLSTTLQGLTTVRAFKAQDRFVDKFDAYQDTHSEAWFAFLAVMRWFGIMLDWITAIFLILVTFLAVMSKDLFDLDASQVGLSLTYALGLVGTFQWGVRQSTEIENLMTSTERILEYSKLEPEASLESEQKPDPNWPQEGAVEFNEVELKYTQDGPSVLKGVTMKIAPNEKIGIVGRTGAGKSSLTVALMRLAEPAGTITIDGVKLSDLGLHDVRKNISFIPQDPTLFSGTLRKNLDPFLQHGDDDLWKVLKEVQLQAAIEEYPEKLEMRVMEGGTNFSVGQRQLLCLARAMLQQNKALLIDEATANVDMRTDQLIQATIREKFKDCTVLTIAHRLNTIIDSDRIMVMEEGVIIEFDEPYTLLQDPLGHLTKMVSETGSCEAERLREIAVTKFASKHPSEIVQDEGEER